MRSSQSSTHSRWRLPAMAATAAGLSLLCPPSAQAHFILSAPACYSVQDNLGTPVKSAPCGQADPGNPVVPTNKTTTFMQGQTITVTINETVYHPGFYRVSIAQDQNSLPMDPPVTAGATPCGSTTASNYPGVVADMLLQHSTAFTAPQSVSVTLPPNLTCTNCVLQVTEFMSNHALNNPGGCFYHHCANISIMPQSPMPDDGVLQDLAQMHAPDDGGTGTGGNGGGSMASGCRMAASPNQWGEPLAGIALLGLLLYRRRVSARARLLRT